MRDGCELQNEVAGKEVIKGCAYVLSPDYKRLTLTPNQIQVLLQLHILPYSVTIDGEPRLLILSTQGQPMDLRLPSSDRQKKEKSKHEDS